MKTNPAKATTRKVLIIEDEGDLCLLLNLLLDEKNMEVDHVPSLAKAGEYLLQAEPAIVLLDNRLPDGFGIDFIGSIKNNILQQSDHDIRRGCRRKRCSH